MRKILLSLAALLVMSGVSSADFVYSTSAGHLGTVKVAASFDIEAPSVKYTGNHSSPFLTSYWNGSGTSLALIDRNAGTSGDMAYVFSPGGLENFTYSADIEGVYGTSAAGYAESGYSLFLTTGSMLYEVNVNSFSVMNSFDCTRIISDEVYPTEIESIAVDSSLIHIIASAGNARRYMRFEGQLDDTKYSFLSADIPDGASPILSISNSSLVAGHSYGVDELSSRGIFYRIVSTDYPVKALCRDSGSSFFYAEQRQSGDVYVNTVSHADNDTRFSPVTITSSSPNIRLVRDNSRTEIFAAMTDEALRVFMYKDGLTYSAEYSASELGGTPAGIAAASVSGYDKNSNSSGCDVSGLGLVILAGLFFMRRK